MGKSLAGSVEKSELVQEITWLKSAPKGFGINDTEFNLVCVHHVLVGPCSDDRDTEDIYQAIIYIMTIFAHTESV